MTLCGELISPHLNLSLNMLQSCCLARKINIWNSESAIYLKPYVGMPWNIWNYNIDIKKFKKYDFCPYIHKKIVIIRIRKTLNRNLPALNSKTFNLFIATFSVKSIYNHIFYDAVIICTALDMTLVNKVLWTQSHCKWSMQQ